MMEEFSLWVGAHLGSESHQICVLDAARRVLLEATVEHSGKALSELAERLLALAEGRAERLAVGIETPRAAIVETFLDRGIAVFALNPKQLDRFRDRHTVGGAKDDRRNAYVLADSLRTDQPSFRAVKLSSAAFVEAMAQHSQERLTMRPLLKLLSSPRFSLLWARVRPREEIVHGFSAEEKPAGDAKRWRGNRRCRAFSPW